LKIRVYYEDTDLSGFVYHSNYLNFCERARSEIFFQKGLSPIQSDSHFVVSKIEANFIKPAKFQDILEIKTEVLNIKNVSIQLLQTIWKEDKKIFEMKIILAHLKSEKTSKIDEVIKNIFLDI